MKITWICEFRKKVWFFENVNFDNSKNVNWELKSEFYSLAMWKNENFWVIFKHCEFASICLKIMFFRWKKVLKRWKARITKSCMTDHLRKYSHVWDFSLFISLKKSFIFLSTHQFIQATAILFKFIGHLVFIPKRAMLDHKMMLTMSHRLRHVRLHSLIFLSI